MDEPTNHLDMECIDSLNTALEKYRGTLIFVSHDREFVSTLATRIIEMTPAGIAPKLRTVPQLGGASPLEGSVWLTFPRRRTRR